METILKTCPECGGAIHGRSDKKFCSTDCRTYYHNKHRGLESNMMRAINCVLQRNRRILMECSGGTRSAKVAILLLQSRGFDFSYYTHCRPDKKGREIRYCYDYGYLRADQGKVIISAISC